MKFSVLGIFVSCLTHGVIATSMGFGNTGEVFNTRDKAQEDVDLKQTIVVSTKVLNNNRRGIQKDNNDDSGTLTYTIESSEKPKRVYVPDVRIIKGFKAVETTNLKPPHFNRPATRKHNNNNKYPDYLVNRDIRDDYDIYPNLATPINPNGFQPSSFFNNINWWNQDSGFTKPRYDFGKSFLNDDDHTVKLYGKTNDDNLKEFYCRRCRELSQRNLRSGCFGGNNGPVTPSWSSSTTLSSTTSSTTARTIIDGKLAEFS